MSQIQFQNKSIILHVKRPPIIMVGLMLLFNSVLVFLPIYGLVLMFVEADEPHIRHFIALGAAGFLAVFGVRYCLWNLFGKEVITLNENSIHYYTDYKFFREKVQDISIENLKWRFVQIGYVEDQKGLLIMESADGEIQSSVKMPIQELSDFVFSMEKINPPTQKD